MMDARKYETWEQYQYCRELKRSYTKGLVILDAFLLIFPLPFGLFVMPSLFVLYMISGLALIVVNVAYLNVVEDIYLLEKYRSKQAYEKLLDKAIQGDY